MARETIFEEQEVSGFAQDGGTEYVSALYDAPAFEVGETYTVSWDGVEYEYTSQELDGIAYLGAKNCDPFAINYIPAGLLGNETPIWYIATVSNAESHIIGLYQKEAIPEKIIIKDPGGNDVEYPDKPMIRLNTTKGTTLYSKGEVLDSITIEPDFSAGDMTVTAPDGYLVKNAVIAKPEDCEPENILKGKNIGNIVGTLELQELVATTIDPDFSAGNMVITPESGQAFNNVTVTKPENLKPENIAKNEVVAGIVGTHEGGGGDVPCVFEAQGSTIMYDYNLATGIKDTTCNVSIQMPNAEVKSVRCCVAYFGSSSSSGIQNAMYVNPMSYGPKSNYTITVGTSSISVKFPGTVTCYYKYGIRVAIVCVNFTIPGMTLKETADGITLHADSNVTNFQGAFIARAKDIKVIDWSESLINQLSQYVLYECVNLKKVILPPTIKTVFGDAFVNLENVLNGLVIDLSRCTTVPTGYNISAIDGIPNLQILISSALYDEWIAATNWSAIADYIVAV